MGHILKMLIQRLNDLLHIICDKMIYYVLYYIKLSVYCKFYIVK